MTEEGKKDCCSTGSGGGSCGCCCKKAFFVGMLAGVILISAGFGIAMGTKCAVGGGMAGKPMMCPVSGTQTH